MTKKDMLIYIKDHARKEFDLLAQTEGIYGFDSREACEQRAVWHTLHELTEEFRIEQY